MGIYSIKPWFRNQLQPLIKLLWNVHPDVLTWSALLLSVACGALLGFSGRHPYMALLAIPLLFLRLALNALDGMLAQQTGKARVEGEVLNEASDRLADMSIFVGIALIPSVSKTLGLAALCSIFMVSYFGILGKAVGADRVYSGILGKADRMILLMVACLLYGLFPRTHLFGLSIFALLFALFIPLALVTITHRLAVILGLLRAMAAPDQDKKN